MPNRKTIGEYNSMVIEVDILFDDIWQWKPHSIPFGIVEPSACLPMDVYHKVEYKLEQAK
jgi:hypothetical protein